MPTGLKKKQKTTDRTRKQNGQKNLPDHAVRQNDREHEASTITSAANSATINILCSHCIAGLSVSPQQVFSRLRHIARRLAGIYL